MKDRLALTRRWVHTLSTEIGIRLSGTESDCKAADFVEAEFRKMFPEVIRHEYRFLAWRPLREGTIEIEGETYPTRLGIACPSTPERGCTGLLRRFGGSHVYGLWIKGQHGPSAHIMVNSQYGGKAIPLLCHPYASTPTGIVGGEVRERLEEAEREGKEVTFTCQVQLFPNTSSWNIEGIIPGDPERWVIVTGHYDTVYVSPGANDNTASLACLPAVADLLLRTPNEDRPTFRFLATGGEEMDLQGSRSYVRDLGWRGDVPKVILALNLDSMTWGDTVQVGSSDHAAPFSTLFDQAYRATPLSTYRGDLRKVGLGGGVDSFPFYRAGIPTINLNTEGDADTTSLWHTPEDTEDRVPWTRVQDAIMLLYEFFERIE